MTTLKELRSIDVHQQLGSTKTRMKSQYGWNTDFINGAINEYHRFLLLHKNFPTSNIVPGKIIDIVWHDHILHTKAYAEFCNIYLGYFLHHMPGLKVGDNIKATYEKYVQLFGHEPPQQYWAMQSSSSKTKNIIDDDPLGCG